MTARARPEGRSAVCSTSPTPTALLVEMRLLFDQHGRPFERTETRYVADRYVIDVVHTRLPSLRIVGAEHVHPVAAIGAGRTEVARRPSRAAPIAPAWGPSEAGTTCTSRGPRA